MSRASLRRAPLSDSGRLIVTHVRRDGPAFEVGLNVDDEIIAFDGVCVRPDGLVTRLEQYRPGDEVSVLAARRDRLIQLDVTLGTEPGRKWSLEISPSASDTQKTNLSDWLGECV